MNKYKNITASGVITTKKGVLVSVTVNSHTSGTLALKDGTTAGGITIFNTITFPATATLTDINRTIALGNVSFEDGLFAVVGGTADLTLSYK